MYNVESCVQSRFGIVSTALGAGQHLVEQLPGLLVARDVEEHHDAAQHSVQDGEASVQRRVLYNRLLYPSLFAFPQQLYVARS